ncbi:hypothetical protein MHK_008402 [Candidatus Magnetomorum sp. HK-1]|nr:hypothetical protein MHK_008402 [Candidatus Magnetomorum sp. HK-1]
MILTGKDEIRGQLKPLFPFKKVFTYSLFCLLIIIPEYIHSDIKNSIQILKIISGNKSIQEMPYDLSNDNKIDLQDVIIDLKNISGVQNGSEIGEYNANGLWTLSFTKTFDSKGEGIGITETGIILINQASTDIHFIDKQGNNFEGVRDNNFIIISGDSHDGIRYEYRINLTANEYLTGQKIIQHEYDTFIWQAEFDIKGVKDDIYPAFNVSGIWDVKSFHNTGIRIGISEIFMTPNGQIIGKANLTSLAGNSMINGFFYGHSIMLSLNSMESEGSMHATGLLNNSGDQIAGVFFLNDKNIEIKWSGEKRYSENSFDASGIWNLNILQTYNGKLDPILTEEEAIITIHQSENNFTFVDKTGEIFQGKVSGNNYIFNKLYSNGNEIISGLCLNSETSLTGIKTISWEEDTYSWKDQYNITGTKSDNEPAFDITGTWNVTRLLGSEIIAGFVNVNMKDDGTITGNAFLPKTIDGESLVTGKLSDRYFVFRVNSIDSPNTLYASGKLNTNGNEISGIYYLNNHIFEVSWSGIKQTQ